MFSVLYPLSHFLSFCGEDIPWTLGKFCRVVLSHPVRKLTLLWMTVFHLQLDKQELKDKRVRVPLSPTEFPVFRMFGWPVSLSPAETFGFLNSVLRSQNHVMVRCDTAAGFAVTLNWEHGEESPEDLYQRQPGYARLQSR